MIRVLPIGYEPLESDVDVDLYFEGGDHPRDPYRDSRAAAVHPSCGSV